MTATADSTGNNVMSTNEYVLTATWQGAPVAGDRPISLDQMSQLFGVDANTPYTWSHRGQLPPHAGVNGRSRYWWESDIIKWYEQRKTTGGRPALQPAA